MFAVAGTVIPLGNVITVLFVAVTNPFGSVAATVHVTLETPTVVELGVNETPVVTAGYITTAADAATPVVSPETSVLTVSPLAARVCADGLVKPARVTLSGWLAAQCVVVVQLVSPVKVMV